MYKEDYYPSNNRRNFIEQQYLEKSSLNRLIINLEGFQEAAEMSLNNIDLTPVDERLKIHEAIDIINKKASELLDQNRQLAFHLKQQHLIDDALSYA
ncbi:unnamed protein product [Adineta steineri]|uniref:Uncharacterized protein n=1 Tax=Adineta steineri TaxID=433720 RepID=A0A820C7V3_9BILA|nr:unnamed protein product [Adineta steineri]CAF4219286.1 unnamed protein product [Adineta steineri]